MANGRKPNANRTAERTALVQQIKAAFANVGRAGGVSWSQSEVIDNHGTEEEESEARHRDSESDWTQLIDDPAWQVTPGIGGFSFLDPIGFRYYLPAAMVRCVQSGLDEGIAFHLTLPPLPHGLHDWVCGKWSGFDKHQRACVAEFIRWMIAWAHRDGYDHEESIWREAWQCYWKQYG